MLTKTNADQPQEPFTAAGCPCHRQAVRDVHPGMPLPGENAMNFRKLPKEKRNKLIAVVVGTLVAAGRAVLRLDQVPEQNLVRLAQKKVDVEKPDAGKCSMPSSTPARSRPTWPTPGKRSPRRKPTSPRAICILGHQHSPPVQGCLQSQHPAVQPAWRAPRTSTCSPISPISKPPFRRRHRPLPRLRPLPGRPRESVPPCPRLEPEPRCQPSPAAEDQETVSFKLDIVTLVKTNPS